MVAASVIVAGMLMARGAVSSAALWAALFAAGGLVHGYAFGESIFGAETTPLAAYLIGLVVIQSALAIGIAAVARRPRPTRSGRDLPAPPSPALASPCWCSSSCRPASACSGEVALG